MGLVYDGDVPWNTADFRWLRRGEMIRAYDQAIFLIKCIGRALFDQSVKDLCVQDYDTREVEFLLRVPVAIAFGAWPGQ